MGKKYVMTRRENLDAWCYFDLNTKNGFLITEPADMSMDGVKRQSLFGPRSELFGTTYSDEQAFAERWRCQCGDIKGYQFAGETCPICGTKIESRDVNIEFTGWISFGKAKIINPVYFNILRDLIGKTAFNDIITCKQKVDRDGHRSKLTEEDFEQDKKPSSPFAYIGIEEFIERFDEIMQYYINKKKNKASFLTKIKDEEYMNVFTSHIPVYSTFLRPQSLTSESFYYTGVDKQINTIFTLSDKLKEATDIERPLILNRIQSRANELWEINFQLLNGKSGFIRDQIMGGGLNFTSRNVIIPDASLHDNEIDLSYHTFHQLFKMKILYYLEVTENCTLSQAHRIWRKGYKCNKKLLELMNFIIKKEDICCLINRNPTLNYYSMLLMHIREIKSDDNDYTMSTPLSILPGLNADYDGDILNIIGCQTEEIRDMFKKFDPIKRMIISRDTGYLNPYFAITKSEKINLYGFMNL
ncbi:MAG TPA: hypothetical protein DCW90_00350 [Lachnospiraceae bacterium]|nr:hypothetical protein [Lachnospiraceae bacterium]